MNQNHLLLQAGKTEIMKQVVQKVIRTALKLEVIKKGMGVVVESATYVLVKPLEENF